MTHILKRFCLALLFSIGMVYANNQVNPDVNPVERLKVDMIEVIDQRPEVSRWAYISDHMSEVVRYVKEQAQAAGHAIDVAYNQINHDSRSVAYEDACKLVEEVACYEDQLTKELKHSLYEYKEALENGNAEIKLVVDEDEVTRNRRRKVHCNLIVRDCLQAGNLEVCGLANLGALNVLGNTSLGNTTLRTGSLLTVNGNAIFNGLSTFNGPLVSNSSATFNGSLISNGGAVFAGDTVFTGTVVLPGGSVVGPGGVEGNLVVTGNIFFDTDLNIISAVGAPEEVRLVRGVIDPTLLGFDAAIVSGAGFAVSGSLLATTVVFDTPFLDIPAIVVSGEDIAPASPISLTDVTPAGFTIVTTGTSPAALLHFHAIGAR